MREAYVDYYITAHNFNQIKVKIKEFDIAVENLLMEERHDGLGWYLGVRRWGSGQCAGTNCRGDREWYEVITRVGNQVIIR